MKLTNIVDNASNLTPATKMAVSVGKGIASAGKGIADIFNAKKQKARYEQLRKQYIGKENDKKLMEKMKGKK